MVHRVGYTRGNVRSRHKRGYAGAGLRRLVGGDARNSRRSPLGLLLGRPLGLPLGRSLGLPLCLRRGHNRRDLDCGRRSRRLSASRC